MKVTIVNGPFYPAPPAPCGAVERRWFHVGQELANMGHQVQGLGRAWAGVPDDQVINKVRYRRSTRFSQTGKIGIDLAKDLVFSSRMLSMLPRSDIIVSNNFWLPVLATRLRPSVGRVVVNVARMPKGQMKLYTRAARLVAVSEAVRQAILKEAPALAAKVSVINNPIDTDLFRPADVPDQRHPGSKLVLLYVGRIHPEKGCHLLVEAYAALLRREPELRNGTVLRLIGPQAVEQGGGGEEYIARLNTAARDLPVEVCSPIYDRPALAEEYRRADYFVYPSLAETGESFGVAPLEAMGTGLPTLVSALECFQDFMNDSTGYTFDHRGAEPVHALEAALATLLRDPDAALKGQRAAMKAATFSYRSIAERWEQEFEQILKERADAA